MDENTVNVSNEVKDTVVEVAANNSNDLKAIGIGALATLALVGLAAGSVYGVKKLMANKKEKAIDVKHREVPDIDYDIEVERIHKDDEVTE